VSTVQKRGFDVPLGPSPVADPESVQIAYEYVASATVWLLVGTAIGLLASLKLNWPDLLAVPWLSFGRLRAIHTNVVFWGWSTNGLVGIALYVVSRTSRAPLWRPGPARLALWLLNGVALSTVVTLAAGITRGPQEYREIVLPLAAALATGVVLNGVVIYRTLAQRRVREIYVSSWYILGAFCWITALVVVAYLPGKFAVGLPNVVIQVLHAQRGRHVVHAGGARAQLLRDSASPWPTDLVQV
jgi:cytochrome c oxidase cbb3-type subunit 1